MCWAWLNTRSKTTSIPTQLVINKQASTSPHLNKNGIFGAPCWLNGSSTCHGRNRCLFDCSRWPLLHVIVSAPPSVESNKAKNAKKKKKENENERLYLLFFYMPSSLLCCECHMLFETSFKCMSIFTAHRLWFAKRNTETLNPFSTDESGSFTLANMFSKNSSWIIHWHVNVALCSH